MMERRIQYTYRWTFIQFERNVYRHLRMIERPLDFGDGKKSLNFIKFWTFFSNFLGTFYSNCSCFTVYQNNKRKEKKDWMEGIPTVYWFLLSSHKIELYTWAVNWIWIVCITRSEIFISHTTFPTPSLIRYWGNVEREILKHTI